MATDDELSELLARALDDDAPPAPPADRIAALRAARRGAGDRRRRTARRRRRRHRRRRPASPWLAAAAAVVALAASAFGLARLLDDGDGAEVAGDVEFDGAMTGPDGQPRRRRADGRRPPASAGSSSCDTDVLPILPTGEYYEVWFVGPDDAPGTPEPDLGRHVPPRSRTGRSDVQFAAAVNPELYPVVEITAEPGDGNPLADRPVVLRADDRRLIAPPPVRSPVAKTPAIELEVGGRTVRISNPDRVYFPATARPSSTSSSTTSPSAPASSTRCGSGRA